MKENYRSLEARYLTRAEEYFGPCEAAKYRFREHPAANGTDKLAVCVQVLKACACFDYQACESGDYRETEAAHIINHIRKMAIGQLPGYEAAEWGAPERPAPLASGTPAGPVSLLSIMAGRA